MADTGQQETKTVHSRTAPPERKEITQAAAWELYEALRASEGYLLNAKIDLDTGAPKRAAIATIDGGLKRVRAALAKAEGRIPGDAS